MIVLYTAIIGESDTIKPAPVGADRCICVSDRRRDEARLLGWEVLRVTAVRRLVALATPRHVAWAVRCHPELVAPEADVTVWADASFTVIDLPALLRDAGDAACAGMRHHDRSSCYEEGWTLVAIGQATAEDIIPQLEAYQAAGFDPTTLTIAGLLVRRSTATVQAFNEVWEAEIDRHPGDNTQVSLDYSAWSVGLPIHYVQGSYIDNPYVVYDSRDHKRRRQAYR